MTPNKKLILFIVIALALRWIQYNVYKYKNTIEKEVVAEVKPTWFEVKVDEHLQKQKRLIMLKFTTELLEKQLEEQIKDVKQNNDMIDSSLNTIQSEFNDVYKQSFYSWAAAF